jgi:hypothetical protein
VATAGIVFAAALPANKTMQMKRTRTQHGRDITEALPFQRNTRNLTLSTRLSVIYSPYQPSVAT